MTIDKIGILFYNIFEVRRGDFMYKDRIILTPKDILEKEFKFDTRGYRPQEVDKYLDDIMTDYEEYEKIIGELENEKRELIEDNIKLKQEMRLLNAKLDVVKEGTTAEVSNADILRRISNLEKLVYDIVDKH